MGAGGWLGSLGPLDEVTHIAKGAEDGRRLLSYNVSVSLLSGVLETAEGFVVYHPGWSSQQPNEVEKAGTLCRLSLGPLASH